MTFRGKGGRGGGIREGRGDGCAMGLGGDAPGGGLVSILQGGMEGPAPQYGGLGAMPPENFSKINVEIAYFLHFCKLK